MAISNSARRMAVHYSSENHNWGTPRDFFAWLHAAFRFTVDVCADAKNAKLRRYWSERDDGLAQSWAEETGFSNPEYGDQLPRWTSKGRFTAIEYPRSCSAFLVPSRVDTEWFTDTTERPVGRLVRSFWQPESRVFWRKWQGLTVGVYHHDQRLKFEGMASGDSAPFPSSVIILAHPTWRPPAPSKLPGWNQYCARPLLTLGFPT